MAHCPNCGVEVPEGARYCPNCGAEQARRPTPQEQPPLPFSPWGPPPMAAQPAGAGGQARAEPVVGPPLSWKQVAIAVGAILLFLLFVILYFGRGTFPWFGRSTTTGTVPVLGVKGELIETGSTAWGVAFTDTPEQIGERTPQRGQFLAVGVVVGNRGNEPIALSRASVGLMEGDSGERYEPTLTAWGTPDQLNTGDYTERYTLSPEEAIAGIVVFDVPSDLAEPRLLIRDLSQPSDEFTGAIDLTREVEE